MKEQLSTYFDEERLIIHIPESNDFNAMSDEEFLIWQKKLKNYQLQESRP